MIDGELHNVAHKVASLVRDAGGRAYIVGGAVRDHILGRPVKDVDIEVFGLSAGELECILSTQFKLDLVGKSFGVFKLHHYEIDIALPRRESKTSSGHRGFDIEEAPDLTIAEAASRRDFTINAIYLDPLDWHIEDPFGGRRDLELKILRHVSEKFKEDPLRVLRGMQFVARFDLSAADETIAICREMTIENLPAERLFEEWRKLLLKGRYISKGLEFLRATGWVRYFPELERLIGCEQSPEWHPEGDVWNHTLCCLDAFAKRRTDNDEEELIIGLAVLCHDLGKPQTTAWDFRARRIRAIGHDEQGVEPTIRFLRRLTNEERILKEVPPLVKCHMSPFSLWKAGAGDAAIRRLAVKVVRIDRLLRVAQADDEGRPPFPSQPEPIEWLASRARRLDVRDHAPQPLVQGRDLIELGLKPSPRFGIILERCYEAQIEGRISTTAEGIAYLKNEHLV